MGLLLAGMLFLLFENPINLHMYFKAKNLANSQFTFLKTSYVLLIKYLCHRYICSKFRKEELQIQLGSKKVE